MKTTLRLILAGLALAPFSGSPLIASSSSVVISLSAPANEPSVDELKAQITELRGEIEKLKAERADTAEDDVSHDAGTPSDLAPLHIYGTVECDLDKIEGISDAQRRDLKEWRLLRLGEWNAAARLAAAEHPDVESTDHGTGHWTINLHWTLVRKAGGITTVCCHVAEDTCGAHPINFVHAFNFLNDSGAVVTPRKLFANAEVLERLRELIANHRDEATDRCFGDYDAKWEKKLEAAGEEVESKEDGNDSAEASDESDSQGSDDSQPGEMADGSGEPDDADDDDQAGADKFEVDWHKLTQIAVTNDSLLFCFDQGLIGPMSDGALVIPVPVAELRDLLSAEGRALFPNP